MLVEEVERRTQVRWPVVEAWPAEGVPVISVGPAAAVEGFAGRHAAALAEGRGEAGAEGYRIRTRMEGAAPAVFVVGNDARGVLFGVGRLLRALEMRRGTIR